MDCLLPLGFQNWKSTVKQVEQLKAANIDFIEIGIPFSDPMADGETIQESSAIALKNGMNLGLIFEQLAELPSDCPPLVLMGYLNPVLNFGMDNFLQKCKETNISGVILPDISVEIFERLYAEKFAKFDIQCIFLITVDTPLDRLEKIAKHSKKGFVYLTSSNKTTGVANKFELIEAKEMDRIRKTFSDTPIFIGFGIKNKVAIQEVQSIADGAIIGSAYINAIKAGTDKEFLQEIFETSAEWPKSPLNKKARSKPHLQNPIFDISRMPILPVHVLRQLFHD